MTTATKLSKNERLPVISGDHAEKLLSEISTWGNVTTIVIHQKSVFEFKGPFPEGVSDSGYYNLKGEFPGFEGHLNLTAVDHIAFQEKLHRGRQSYAFVFTTESGAAIFKIFLGRDSEGNIHNSQLALYENIKQTYGTTNEK
jgi:putative heme utilization carrier protein HutX